MYNRFAVNRYGRVHNRKGRSTAALDLVVSAQKVVLTNADGNQASGVTRTIISRFFPHFGGRIQADLEETENVLRAAVRGKGLGEAVIGREGQRPCRLPRFPLAPKTRSRREEKRNGSEPTATELSLAS